jgi:hypothetical protein
MSYHDKSLFEDPCLKTWLLFAKDQLKIFQTYIKSIKCDDISATEVALHVDTFRNILVERKNEKFIGTTVKLELAKLLSNNKITEESFFTVIENFYEPSVQYIEK